MLKLKGKMVNVKKVKNQFLSAEKSTMKSIPEFVSLEGLRAHLKRWISVNPKAVQLDGSPVRKSNRGIVALVWVEHECAWYKIHGDTKVDAAKRFIRLFDTGRRGASLLKEVPSASGLILGCDFKPSGWFCYFYSDNNPPVAVHERAAKRPSIAA